MAGQAERKIAFINQATGYLTIDIINAFVCSKGFSKVALIAGSIRVQDVPLDPAVRWSRIVLYNRGGPVRKFVSWLIGTLQTGWLLLTTYRSYEVFYVTIPPFAYWWSWLLPNRFTILVFDVYPDVLAIYNIGKKNLIYRFWSWLNRRLFRKAYRVYTLGNGMASLLGQYVNPARIKIIPNWSGLRNLRIVERSENSFLVEQGLVDQFVVQYSGNIGYTHNVEVLIDLAKVMGADENVFFLIVGRGERYNILKAQVENDKMHNCRILPFQPDNRLSETLSAAHLGVVILDDKTAHVSMPSKIYNLQAAGVPVLCIADKTSELARHVMRHNIGRCFDKEDLQGMTTYILELRRNPDRLKQLRQNAVAAARNYTWTNATLYADTYVQELG